MYVIDQHKSYTNHQTMKQLLSLAVVTLLLVSCGPKIYQASNFNEALSKHKTVAILPAEVTMQLRPNQTKNMTQEQLDEMAMKMGYDIQEKMYGWFLRRGDKFEYTVSFQDVVKAFFTI